jgi:Phosphatidylethanolamine-binding protein
MKYVLSLHQNTRLAVIVLATILLTLRGSAVMAMTLSSPAFKQNGHIPAKYTCEGADVSPPLAWEGVPNGAKSLVLIIDDPDAPDPKAPKMVWVHWIVYNIPPEIGPCPRTQARQGCLKAPYLGSMISKKLGTAAVSADRSAPLLPKALRAGYYARSKRRDKMPDGASNARPCAGQRRAHRHVPKR